MTPDQTREPIPVLRPRLPEAERLLPYLKRIDASRVYSNFGPLALELESRLIDRLGLPDLSVVSASSGFAAIVGAILAEAGRATAERPYALLPSFTFIATAAAAEQCGYQPLLADVDAHSWQLDPVATGAHPLLARCGVVLPVAPFGRAVPLAGWQAFRDRTGVPVVVDGAASFDLIEDDPSTHLGDIPVALSFHATKSFATGEGGAVLTRSEDVARRALTALNFGFYGSRESVAASINGKLDEYSAAVGLAELDAWAGKRAAMATVARAYRDAFDERGIGSRLHVAPRVSGTYVLYQGADDQEVARIEAELARARVDFRRWYGDGLHRQPYLAASPCATTLHETARLSRCLLGLPFAVDLGADAIARVADAVSLAVLR